jgi:hypothetical protein
MFSECNLPKGGCKLSRGEGVMEVYERSKARLDAVRALYALGWDIPKIQCVVPWRETTILWRVGDGAHPSAVARRNSKEKV